MSYAIADKAKMESAVTVLHSMISEELKKGKNAKFPRAKVLQMLSQAMYSRSHEELLATVYKVPVDSVGISNATDTQGLGTVVITRYLDWATLYVDGHFASHVHKSINDYDRLHNEFMEKANFHAQERGTTIVEAQLPHILPKDELNVISYKTIAASMGYFNPEGSIFTRLENANLIEVNGKLCQSRLNPQWREALAASFNDDYSLYDLDGEVVVWTIECGLLNRFSAFSADIYFDQLRHATCIDPVSDLWSIPNGEDGVLIVKFS